MISETTYRHARMKPNLHALIVCLVATLLLIGCATVKKQKKSLALEAATTGYGAAIRWGYFETAYGFAHPDKRKEVPENLENIRVTGYEIVQPPVMKDGKTAVQITRIEYLHRDMQRIRSLSDKQEWRYDVDSNTWWLHSGVPEFD